jgi:hypothetical protein
MQIHPPTTVFREKDTAYGLRYCPENQLAKDLAEAFDRNCITGEGIVSLRKCGIKVELIAYAK